MTKDDFKNTKWDVREWSDEDKRELVKKATGDIVTFSVHDIESIFIDEEGYWTHGLAYNLIGATEELKLHSDAFPEKYITMPDLAPNQAPQLSGGSCNYYIVEVKHPTTAPEPYSAECNDIIESLGLTFAEANIYKEIWRTANGRTHNNGKPDNDPKRAAEKVLFFALREALHNGVDIQKLIDGVNIK
ncbi:hypothetical protein [Vibrio phage LP.1]|nr:hypothetical protein [Vibrio phage LP.1]